MFIAIHITSIVHNRELSMLNGAIVVLATRSNFL